MNYKNVFLNVSVTGFLFVIYWPLTELSIKRCTCVNKQKKKRKQEGVMKEYRQVPVAVELVGTGMPEWGPACRLRAVVLSDPRLSNPSQDAKEVLSGFLKAMVKRRSWVNIAVCPCPHSSLTHHRNINPLENKVWEIYFYKEVCLFVHWSSSFMFDYVSACICMWLYNIFINRDRCFIVEQSEYNLLQLS